MRIASPAPSFASGPISGTASAVKLAFGDWFERIGIAGGGDPLGTHELRLRMSSNEDALGASAAFVDVLDGVRILVRQQDNGQPPHGVATAAAAARLLERIPGVLSAQAGDGAFIVTSTMPDVNAKLDWIVRDEIDGLSVRWRTGDPSPQQLAV